MNSPHQVKVAAEEAFRRASERRETLRRQVQPIVNDIKDLECEIASQEEVKRDARTSRDLMQAHANKLFSKGMVAKAKKKVARRNVHAQACQDAYERIGAYHRTHSDLKKLLIEREEELNLPACEQEYYEKRHAYMVATRDADLDDEQARHRVESYLAFLAHEGVDASGVLYYRIGDKIHLFYGGKALTEGGDPLPDGPGHGHVVLAATYNGSLIRMYQRHPAR